MFNSKLSNVRDDGKFYEMPTGKLIGFDTETTGIWRPPLTCACSDHQTERGGLPVRDCPRIAPTIRARDKEFGAGQESGKDMSLHEPLSYGFTTYKDGQQVQNESETYLVKPDIHALDTMMADPEKFAYRTHDFSPKDLENSYSGLHITNNGIVYPPAIDRVTGMRRAVDRLADAYRNGDTLVGANLLDFDIPMLAHHFAKATGSTIQSAGFDPQKMYDEGRIIDVMKHQWAMEGRPFNTKNQPFRRSLSDSKINKIKQKDTLSDIYGIEQGNHTAAEDARASIDVAIRQILTNNGQFRPNPIRLK